MRTPAAILRMTVVASVLVSWSLSASAADYPTPAEGVWTVRDFRFHSGERSELRLHYTTIGRSGNEPVLVLHGTGESANNLLSGGFAGELFGAGQPLDANRYFIVLPDAIGHGRSSKPSDGLRTRFPHYDYRDMVTAQYRLLTQHLGIRHLKVVLGNSMGGMHVWLWGEMYPTFMDNLVALASEPAAMAGRNWMIRRFVIDAIRGDPAWDGGNYVQQPSALKAALAFYGVVGNGGSLARYRRTPSREKTDTEYERLLSVSAPADANDVLYQFESAAGYDPTPGLDRIAAKLLAINSADDEKNPPELGVMEAAMARLKNGRYVLLPITDQSRGHGTTVNAILWKRYLTEFMAGD